MSARSGRTALTAAKKPCSMESIASANPSELLCRLKKTSANSMLRVSAIFHHGTDSTDAPLANSNLTISICLLRTASPSARLNARGYSSRQFPAPSNSSNIENCRLFTATERSESRLDSGLHIGWPSSSHRRRKSELPDSTASLRGSSLASYCVVGIRIICSTSSSHSRRLGVPAMRHANRLLLSIINFMAYRPHPSLHYRFHQSWKQVHLPTQQHHQLTEVPMKRLQSLHTHLHMSFANHLQRQSSEPMHASGDTQTSAHMFFELRQNQV